METGNLDTTLWCHAVIHDVGMQPWTLKGEEVNVQVLELRTAFGEVRETACARAGEGDGSDMLTVCCLVARPVAEEGLQVAHASEDECARSSEVRRRFSEEGFASEQGVERGSLQETVGLADHESTATLAPLLIIHS